MASEVDISNLALGYLGDAAQITAISPPDGSVQAALCSRFYPMARDELLEMHTWGFATVRTAMALLSVTPPSSWTYVYAQPTDALNLLAVLDPNAADDYSVPVQLYGSLPGPLNNVTGPAPAPSFGGIGVYTPAPFASEVLSDGTEVIYTNMQNAVLRYTKRVTDTTLFSPLFNGSLAQLLASKLAGPILKGESGRKAAQDIYAMFLKTLGRATSSDANQHRAVVSAMPAHMVNR